MERMLARSRLEIGGHLEGGLTISEKIEGGKVIVKGYVGSAAEVGGPDSVYVADMTHVSGFAAVLNFGGLAGPTPPCDLRATVLLGNGLPTGLTELKVWGTAISVASIDLNNAGVVGELIIGTMNGDILRGGDIANQGTVDIDILYGDATFGQIETGGELLIDHVLGGTMTLAGIQTRANMESSTTSGSVSITGDVAGTYAAGFLTGTVTIGGDLTGSLNSGTLSGGTLDIQGGTKAGSTVDIQGSLGSSSDVSVDGTAAGDMTVRGNIDSSSSIVVGGALTGDIDVIETAVPGVGGTLGGKIEVTGDVSGDIHVANNLSDTAQILLHGKLARGRVLIDGTTDGVITIDESTGSTSLIHLLEGLDDNGTVTVNAGRGDFDAEGDILVGEVSPSLPLPSIIYDGCIEILDNGAGSFGDLTGEIDVNGCHSTTDDLGITIEGSPPQLGAITINQTGCTNQVDWSDCP